MSWIIYSIFKLYRKTLWTCSISQLNSIIIIVVINGSSFLNYSFYLRVIPRNFRVIIQATFRSRQEAINVNENTRSRDFWQSGDTRRGKRKLERVGWSGVMRTRLVEERACNYERWWAGRCSIPLPAESRKDFRRQA